MRAHVGLSLVLLVGGCSRPSASEPPSLAPNTTLSGEPSGAPAADSDPSAALGEATALGEAERALEQGDPARAATLFARVLGRGVEGPEAARAYRGLARAHERLGDFHAAIRTYDAYVDHFAEASDAPVMLARRGACEAEVGEWERSAASYAGVLAAAGDSLLPSERVEALTRQGFALFQLGRFTDADRLFGEADGVYASAIEAGQERFGDTYFVAMARFYRAAIVHLEFRAVQIRAPEAQMNADFERKLALLEQAQDLYNDVVRARHVYWVAAAGYQLGSLFEEFYDAMMYAPVPDWLDDTQRRTYYRELEERLRPVVDKAVWVFEKNLETARKLGYDNEFIERTQLALAHLEGVLLGRGDPGQPVPRLAPREARDQEPDTPISPQDLPAAERKLFVPMPTVL
jgi:tetratricopeptide (TPR) repeat protein